MGSMAPGVVDAHVHVFPADMIRDRASYLERDGRFRALYGSTKATMVTPDEVLQQMQESGVAVSVLVGFPFADQGLCRMVNDCILEAVRDHPDRLSGMACVAPDAPGALAELERCLDAGLCGCGELAPEGGGAGEAGLAGGRGLDIIAACLRERDLPLMVHASEPVGHAYAGKGHFTPEACYALAQRNPGLRIVFAHMGGGLFLYETMPEVRRTLADAYYDTAAVPYLYGPEVYDVALLAAGPDKFLFGSDFPLLSPTRYRTGLERLGLPERNALTDGNARRVLKLGESDGGSES